jgi:hypothetical protein
MLDIVLNLLILISPPVATSLSTGFSGLILGAA